MFGGHIGMDFAAIVTCCETIIDVIGCHSNILGGGEVKRLEVIATMFEATGTCMRLEVIVSCWHAMGMTT